MIGGVLGITAGVALILLFRLVIPALLVPKIKPRGRRPGFTAADLRQAYDDLARERFRQ